MEYIYGREGHEDMNFEKSYNKMEAYGQSKLADLLFAYELDRRFKKEGNNSISIGAHPGVSMTELSRHAPKWFFILFGADGYDAVG